MEFGGSSDLLRAASGNRKSASGEAHGFVFCAA